MATCHDDAIASHSPAYPNYALPYRGLPAEIRMLTWRHNLSSVLHVDPGARALITEHQRNISMWDEDESDDDEIDVSLLPSWNGAIQNLDEFPLLNLALLDKMVSSEVMGLLRSSVTWSFAHCVPTQVIEHLLLSLNPSQKYVTKGISLTARQFNTGYHLDAASGLLAQSFKAFRNIDITFRIDHSYDLSVYVAPLDLRDASELDLSISHLMNPTPAEEVMGVLADDLCWKFWTETVAKTVYRLVTEGMVTQFTLRQSGYGESYRLFFSDPRKLLFDNEHCSRYLDVSQLNELDIQLVWPERSDLLSIFITKQVDRK